MSLWKRTLPEWKIPEWKTDNLRLGGGRNNTRDGGSISRGSTYCQIDRLHLQSQQQLPAKRRPAANNDSNKENNNNSAGSSSPADDDTPPQFKKQKNDATATLQRSNNNSNNNKPSFSNDDERDNNDDMDCDDDTAKSTVATTNGDGSSNNNTTVENQSSNLLGSNVSNGDAGLSNDVSSDTSSSIISSIVDGIKDKIVVNALAEGGDSEESANNDLGEEDNIFGDGGGGGNDDGAAAELNEVGVHEFVKSLAETENQEDDDVEEEDDDDMNYESDSNQNLYQPSLPTNSQKGFERALEAAELESSDEEEEEEREDDNEEKSNVDVEQRDDTDTQGAGTDSQPLCCRSGGCAVCPQAAAAASASNGEASGSAEHLPSKVDCDICQDISYKLEECSSDDCNNQVCADHLCSTCKSCEHCCDCQEEEESVMSTSSEVEADGEVGDEDEEYKDRLQDMIDQYEHVMRAEPTKPHKAGIKSCVGRTINNTMKFFNSSGTYGTAIAPCLVICGIIFHLILHMMVAAEVRVAL